MNAGVRSLVGLVVAVFVLGTPTALAQESGPSDHEVPVDGRSLHLSCTGTGAPTVLFEAGGPDAAGGAVVVAQVGADVSAALGSRFCAYDRAGTGRSPADPIGVRTFRDSAEDLQALLASDELSCPCVLIGESLGGSIAVVALASDPSEVAGLVLLDAPFPRYLDEELSMASPDPGATWLTTENPERLDIVASFRQVTTPDAPPAIPIVVVSHGAGDPPMACFPCPSGYPVKALEAAWQEGQADFARALGAQLVVAEDTGHSIAGENPRLVVELVSGVLAAVRSAGSTASPAGSPLPNRALDPGDPTPAACPSGGEATARGCEADSLLALRHRAGPTPHGAGRRAVVVSRCRC